MSFHDLGKGGGNAWYAELLKHWSADQVVSRTYDLAAADPAAVLLDSMSAGLKAAYLRSPNGPMSHGWCVAKVEGKWHEVDPTWDGPEKGKSKKVSYRHFMRSRSYMKKLDYHHKLAVYAPAKVKLSKTDYKMKRQ